MARLSNRFDLDVPSILIIIGAALLVVLMVVLIAYTGMDLWNAQVHVDTAMVVSKQYNPPFTSFIPISTGKTTILMPVNHSARYYLRLNLNGEFFDVEVAPEDYAQVREGNKVRVSYVIGKLSDRIENVKFLGKAASR